MNYRVISNKQFTLYNKQLYTQYYRFTSYSEVLIDYIYFVARCSLYISRLNSVNSHSPPACVFVFFVEDQGNLKWSSN